MNVAQLFQDVRKVQIELDALMAEQERIFTRMTSTHIMLQDVVVSTSGSGDAIPNGVAELADLNTEIQNQMNHIAKKQLQAVRIISRIEKSTYRSVLTWYYINGYTWEMTAEAMKYSPVYIWDLGRKALEEAQRVADRKKP